MGSGQGQRGRCAGGRATSRMALCGSTESAAARCKAGIKRAAYRSTARSTTAAPTGPTSRNSGLQPTEAAGLANQIAATRIWTIDRKTGDVSYTLNGRVSVIDRGRIVTVLNQDEAAVLFGLEMAIQKYGPRIACAGTVEWKRMVTKTAAQHGISVQFTDEEMQHALRLQQRLANPRQRQQERGGR
jgi:hypothetical protein